jgi:cytochrome c5
MHFKTWLLVPLILYTASVLTGCSDDSPRMELPSFPDSELQQGRSTWMRVCRNCHLLGVAGAPAVSDAAAWQSRLARDRQSLYRSAIEGIGDADGWRMPPRGGNDALTDYDVQRAVDYMVAAVEELQR